jgi:outer membrane protein assembly factor BamB
MLKKDTLHPETLGLRRAKLNTLMTLSVLTGFFCFVSGFGQIPDNTGKTNGLRPVKRDSISFPSSNPNQYLKGFHYIFNGKVLSIQVDTAYDNLIAFLKLKNGKDYNEVIAYNPDSDVNLWKYDTYSQNGQLVKNHLALKQFDAGTNNDRVRFLDRKSGELKYFIEDADIFQDPENDLLFAFPKYRSSKQVEIIKEKSGLVLNTLKLTSSFYFSSDVFHDSCIYLNINGIHVLDKNYKTVWEADLKTMQMDVVAFIVSAGLGIGIGVMTGYAPIPAAINYSANLTSEFHFFQKDVFISDKDRIYSFDKKTGEKNWQQKLPHKTGFSIINDANDSILLFLNTGLCVKNGQLQGYCTPYRALINRRTGSVLFHQKFIQSEYIADVRFSQDSALILFNNRICRINNNDSVYYSKEYIFPESFGKGYSITSDSNSDIYVKDSTGSEWHSLRSQKISDNDEIIVTSKGLMILGQDLKLLKYFPMSLIGRQAFENETSKYFEILRTIREDYSVPGGFVKCDKSDSTIVVYPIDRPYIVDHEKLYMINKKSIDVFKLE